MFPRFSDLLNFQMKYSPRILETASERINSPFGDPGGFKNFRNKVANRQENKSNDVQSHANKSATVQ